MIEGKMTRALRMRYLIPFTYQSDPDQTYEAVCSQLQVSKEWLPSTVRAKAEQDIYGYLLDSFEKSERKNNIGTVWRYVGSGEAGGCEKETASRIKGKQERKIPQVLLSLLYLEENRGAAAALMNPAKWIRVNVSQAGLFLFRSGVGFFWYEISLGANELSADQLVRFQSCFKELNREDNDGRIMQLVGHGKLLYTELQEQEAFRTGEDILAEYTKASPEDLLQGNRGSRSKKQLTEEAVRAGVYIPCFHSSGVKYIQERHISLLQKESGSAKEIAAATIQMPEAQKYHPSDFEKLVLCREKTVNDMERQLMVYRCHTFTMGNWIAEVLHTLPVGVEYCAPRRNCLLHLLHTAELSEWVPDKALLFIYAVQKSREMQRDLITSAYYLTNGYTENYKVTANAKDSMFQPFENAVWNITGGGCGYFVEDLNQDFFQSSMREKVVNDYFLLYVLTLHQSYTILQYAGTLEREFSADELDYQKQSDEYTHKLENYVAKINTFFMKSTYASVSHIQHQNDFYAYAQKKLQIKENINSLLMGLEALNEIQSMRHKENMQKRQEEQSEAREIENNNLNIALNVLSVLTVISVLYDATSFIQLALQKVGSFGELLARPLNWIYIVVYVLIGAAGVYAVFRLIRAAVSQRRLRKRSR